MTRTTEASRASSAVVLPLASLVLKVPLVRAVADGVLVAATPPLVVGPVVTLLTGGRTDLPAHVLGVAVLGGLAVLSFRTGRHLLEDDWRCVDDGTGHEREPARPDRPVGRRRRHDGGRRRCPGAGAPAPVPSPRR